MADIIRRPQLEESAAVFFRSLKIAGNYDIVIAVERKGVAFLRMLMLRYKEEKSIFGKTEILSDEALEHLPEEYFFNKRILVFDDSVYKGKQLNYIKNLLERIGAAEVNTACLFVRSGGLITPDFILYNDLSLQAYGEYREEFIDYLSTSDYLLLDSEHMPVRILTDMSSQDFLHVLLKLANVLVIPRIANSEKIYVTLHEPNYFNASSFPHQPDAIFDGIVCKLRVIIEEGKAWLIPLVYPSIPQSAIQKDCPLYKENPQACICSDSHIQPYSDLQFHCQSLYSGTQLLSLTLYLIEEITNKKFPIIEKPFETLKSLFPNSNVKEIKKWVDQTVSNRGISKRSSIRIGGRTFSLYDDEIGFEDATEKILTKLLDAAMQSEIDRQIHNYESYDWIPGGDGLPNSDLINAATFFEELNLSRAIDSLIDQAFIAAIPVTTYNIDRSQEYWSRGMRLSGEYVFNLVRQVY